MFRRTLRFFHCNVRGAAAVEFALISGAVIMTIVFILYVALIMYLNQALDYATYKSARQIQTGFVQQNSISQIAFRTTFICPFLPAAFNCNNVIVNVQTVTTGSNPSGYYNFVNGNATALIVPPLSNTSAQYSVGIQGSYVYLQVVYPITFLPGFFAKMLSGGVMFNGVPAYLAISTATFRNEQY